MESHSTTNISPELLAFEQQLRTLMPQPAELSREELLYQAGWQAALAQHSTPSASTPVVMLTKPQQTRTNALWAAACAVLLLVSAALGWQVWQQPPVGPALPLATVPTAPPLRPNIEQQLAGKSSDRQETVNSAAVSYLELRERVTRGGLTMWSGSTPLRGLTTPDETPTRDWKAELLRETL
jgi:hypothetical protein